MSDAASRHATMLLRFAAGLTPQFRFVATVTILQQGICLPLPLTRRNRPSQEPPGKKGQGITGVLACQRVGQSWRFFPTYAEVQSSPVLRHSFLQRVTTNEC